MLGFAAWSGTGKTTLLERLIPQLAEAGIRVALIKHAHHNFDIDKPGKDSHRLRQAGANPVLVISDRRYALMRESRSPAPVTLDDALLALPEDLDCDLILVEGFKHASIPKIILSRELSGGDRELPLSVADPAVIALACDSVEPAAGKYPELPVLDLNSAAGIAEFVVDWLAGQRGPSGAAEKIAGALEQITTAVPVLTETRRLELSQALGRHLARPVTAIADVPADDNSAMDGYACAFASLQKCAGDGLRVIGEVACGKPFDGRVSEGECVRIFTGGVIPAGCDCVIMQEHSELRQGRVFFMAPEERPFRAGQHIRPAGEDVGAGEVVAEAGQKISPALAGVLASVGIGEVEVLRRPRVAILTNGSELRPLGEPLGVGQSYDSNRYTLSGMLRQAGAEVLDLGIVGDDPAALKNAISSADRQADLILSTGGISVGEHDFVKPVLRELGEVLFSGLPIKPGHPVTFGRLPGSLFFGLPGNPVAVMVCFCKFVLPAIRRLSGERDPAELSFRARLREPLRKLPGRVEFVRGILRQTDDGDFDVRKAGQQGSAILSTMARANCLIELPADLVAAATGEWVKVTPLPWGSMA